MVPPLVSRRLIVARIPTIMPTGDRTVGRLCGGMATKFWGSVDLARPLGNSPASPVIGRTGTFFVNSRTGMQAKLAEKRAVLARVEDAETHLLAV